MVVKEDTNKEVNKNSESTEIKKFNENGLSCIPNTCPKCGSKDLENGEVVDPDVFMSGLSRVEIIFNYFPFSCNQCKFKAIEVYIDIYSHTEIVEKNV